MMRARGRMWAVIAGACLGVPAVGAARPARQSSSPAAGAAAFAKHCETCHGKDASGANGPALVPYSRELDELMVIVRQGVGMMPPLPREQITDEEIGEIHRWLTAISQKEKP